MNKTKISSRGQTVVPRGIRRRYDLREGQRLEWIPWGEQTILVRRPSSRQRLSWSAWAKRARGLHKEIWRGIDPVRYTHELWGHKDR